MKNVLPKRAAIGISVAVLIAALVNYYFSFSHEAWLPLSAFCISLSTRGLPLKQGLLTLLTLLASILFASLVLSEIKISLLAQYIMALILVSSSFFCFFERPFVNKLSFQVLLFAFVLIIVFFSPENGMPIMHARVLDVLIGALIGVVIGRIIFPFNIATEFRQGLLPLLTALLHYSQSLTREFNLSSKDFNGEFKPVLSAKQQVENALLAESGYPEWVYEVGFNPGMRSGLRFFLINTERMSELFFSTQYYLSRELDHSLRLEFSKDLTTVMQKNEELIAILITYFQTQELITPPSDYSTDMSALEQVLQKVVPNDVELIDISPDYIVLTTLVRNIKDLRGLLLQLVMALPAAK